jgi:membrane-associated protease RseP (regulator of RpoE activity)
MTSPLLFYSRATRATLATRAAASAACALALLGGCASHQRPMVDYAGWQPGCEQQGWGLIGAHAATEAHAVCVRSMQAAGFIDTASVGTTGITELFADRGIVMIGAVQADSPAERAGVAPGDMLLMIEQAQVRDPQLAHRLLFGRADTPVALLVKRGDETLDVVLVRAAALMPPNAQPQAAAPAQP